MVTNANPSKIPQQKNSLSILDTVFQKHGWFRTDSTNESSVTYTTNTNLFSRFVVEHVYGTKYKVCIPLTNTQYMYATEVDSVFELLEYVETVLEKFQKKTQ
jgi:glutathionyl-hydroquinone reductase